MRLESLLVEGESLEHEINQSHVQYVFTNLRMIVIDQRIRSSMNAHSIPYGKIAHFAVRTAGRFDRDPELTIWFVGSQPPVTIGFKNGTDMIPIQKLLARHVLRQ